MVKLPKKLNIMGTVYTIEYCSSASEVDIHKRESCQGQIDYWTQTIRVYSSRCKIEQWKTIFHELLHGIGQELEMSMLKDKDNHDQLDVLASILVDTLIRNGWLEIEADETEDGETT